MTDFEISGRWWLPDRPERAVDGVLSRPPGDTVTLSLNGDVEPSREGAFRALERPLLWGEAAGTLITLRGAYTDFVWFNQTYRIRETYLGGHFRDPPLFTEVVFALTDLDSFLGVNWSFARIGKNVDEHGTLLKVATSDGTITFIQDLPLREKLDGPAQCLPHTDTPNSCGAVHFYRSPPKNSIASTLGRAWNDGSYGHRIHRRNGHQST
jgi:hypothetical protein